MPPLTKILCAPLECGHVVPSSTHAFQRSSGPTQVNRGQLRSNEVNELCRLFRVLLPTKVIWGADFDSDIHFALRWLEMRPWSHRVIKGQWRHMTENYFSNFWPLKVVHGHPKTTVMCSARRKEHAGRWNSALAPSEAKLSAITGFRHFFALDLISEVTGWPRSLSCQSLCLVASYMLVFFAKLYLNQGRNGKGVSYHPCAVEGCEMACAGEG